MTRKELAEQLQKMLDKEIKPWENPNLYVFPKSIIEEMIKILEKNE